MGARRWLGQARAWRDHDPASRDPFALQFAGAIVAVATAVTVLLVVVQLSAGWPFGPSRSTTTREELDAAGRMLTSVESTTDEGDARDALWRAVAGIAALTAGLLAWGRLEQSRRQHLMDREAATLAVKTQRLATRAQKATERGQLTGRFTTAVEQLGHPDAEVRLGALYALEALAHDSPPDDAGRSDRRAITEVICAYARHHTPVLGNVRPVKVHELAVDYQAAIAIALRLPADWKLPTRNLSGTVITAVPRPVAGDARWQTGAIDFAWVRFVGLAVFDGVTFTGDASFDHATFESDAWFKDVAFEGVASFFDATFDGEVRFRGPFKGAALFSEATFIGAALFAGATFVRGATFRGATAKQGVELAAGTDPGVGWVANVKKPTLWYRDPDE